VGFLAFLGCEAIGSPASGSADGLIWLPLMLAVATIFAAIPYLVGALLLLAAFRVLPKEFCRFAVLRLVVGGVIGAVIAWPFAFALNWIPSATADPRFDHDSVRIGGAVASAFCAAFFSEAKAGEASNKSLERSRDA
jgi:predicted membrane protein